MDTDNGCCRYAKAWPERLRDHSGWGQLQGDGYRRNNFGVGDIKAFISRYDLY